MPNYGKIKLTEEQFERAKSQFPKGKNLSVDTLMTITGKKARPGDIEKLRQALINLHSNGKVELTISNFDELIQAIRERKIKEGDEISIESTKQRTAKTEGIVDSVRVPGWVEDSLEQQRERMDTESNGEFSGMPKDRLLISIKGKGFANIRTDSHFKTIVIKPQKSQTLKIKKLKTVQEILDAIESEEIKKGDKIICKLQTDHQSHEFLVLTARVPKGGGDTMFLSLKHIDHKDPFCFYRGRGDSDTLFHLTFPNDGQRHPVNLDYLEIIPKASS